MREHLQMLESSLAAKMISSSSTNKVASTVLLGCMKFSPYRAIRKVDADEVKDSGQCVPTTLYCF